jgi:hypothetical protein
MGYCKHGDERLKLIPAEDIPEVWEFVERGLNVILAKAGQCWWTPADVRRFIREGRCFLFVTEGGFVTLEKAFTPNAEPYLNVWHMYFEPGEAAKRKDELIAWLDNMQRKAKCGWIQFTGRPEWTNALRGEFEEQHRTLTRNRI